ncbi:MAG: porin [Leadbetterella sp.]
MIGQEVKKDTTKTIVHSPKPTTPWYNNFSIRGYVQVRYNRLLETNPDLKCEQCDRSIGRDGGFFIRRTRIIFSGQLSKQVYLYLQPDFASSASTTGLHFGQLRDAYFDVGLDKSNEFRIRIGQSKVPFGFENMQSSQNRLPLDRNDALNSALSNERDLGVVFMYAPKKIRNQFASFVKDGFKGSGDYGVFAFGVYNGQTANRPELNDEPHMVARITYPFAVKNQVIEPSIQAYTGNWEMGTDQLSSGIKSFNDSTYKNLFTDRRIAGTLNIYPKPLGILAEYNVGTGPEYNPATKRIENQKLKGGFVTVSYMIQSKGHTIFPFFRGQYYDGGKKHERDARSYTVKEYELGIEWQPSKNFEFVAMYTMSERRFDDYTVQVDFEKKNPTKKFEGNIQKGNLLRLQAQVNF